MFKELNLTMVKTVVKINLKPHVSAYIKVLLAQYFVGSNLHLDSETIFGTFLYSVLEKSNIPPTEPTGDYITFVIPEKDFQLNRFDSRYSFQTVGLLGEKRLNKFFEFLMDKVLFDRCDLLKERGEGKRSNGKVKQEIEGFMTKYKFENRRSSYEALVKRYYRYTKRKLSN